MRNDGIWRLFCGQAQIYHVSSSHKHGRCAINNRSSALRSAVKIHIYLRLLNARLLKFFRVYSVIKLILKRCSNVGSSNVTSVVVKLFTNIYERSVLAADVQNRTGWRWHDACFGQLHRYALQSIAMIPVNFSATRRFSHSTSAVTLWLKERPTTFRPTREPLSL
jgi:hypothetical protein